jgi:hypothetical protein
VAGGLLARAAALAEAAIATINPSANPATPPAVFTVKRSGLMGFVGRRATSVTRICSPICRRCKF